MLILLMVRQESAGNMRGKERQTIWLAPMGAGLLWLGSLVPAAAGAAAATGWMTEQTFDAYSPLAAKHALIDRVLVPTLADRIRRFEQQTGREASEHTVDLANERFDLFVPPRAPDGGYAVMVFVSPMPDFPLSPGWKKELGKQGMIFVSARRSGNQQNVLDRRIPLALHALENVSRRYPVDPQRVYIAGFSGGSRVAWRIARAYADVFSGALLIGGSDAFGEFDTAPPLPAQMHWLRTRSRIVFATGGSDLPNRGKDARTRESLVHFCVPGARTIPVPRVDHWVPPPRKFADALRALESPVVANTDAPACEARLAEEIEQGMREVESLLANSAAADAGTALGKLEDKYGGLLPPRAVALARSIATQLEPAASP